MYLGIDIGTSSVKTNLMDEAQQTIAVVSEALGVSRPQAGWSEQEAESWWAATCTTLDRLAQTHPKQMHQVRGIGLSGQMHGATLLDKNDTVLRPAILWNDGRSTKECKEIEDHYPKLREVAGNIAMAGFTAPKLAWVRKNEPHIFEKICKVLLPKDYVRFRLTGEYVSEMSDAAGTLWLNVAQRKWSDELLATTGLAQEHMPRLVEGSEISAQLRDDLRQRWGIRQTVIVAGGAGDNAASACGMGTIKSGDAFVSIGTSGVLFVANEKFSPNTNRSVHAFCHALPKRWHQMGVILSATDSLQWLSRISGKSVPTLTNNLTSNIIHPADVTFLPYLGGERTPYNDPAARGAFVGLAHEHDLNTLAQAVLEGVAYAFRDCHEALKQVGTNFESAFAIGGGAQSELWLKIIASVLNRPLKIPQGGQTGAAFGAARLAMCAAQGLSPEVICTPPKVERIIKPDAQLVDQYTAGYARYQALYPKISRHYQEPLNKVEI